MQTMRKGGKNISFIFMIINIIINDTITISLLLRWSPAYYYYNFFLFYSHLLHVIFFFVTPLSCEDGPFVKKSTDWSCQHNADILLTSSCGNNDKHRRMFSSISQYNGHCRFLQVCVVLGRFNFKLVLWTDSTHHVFFVNSVSTHIIEWFDKTWAACGTRSWWAWVCWSTWKWHV